MNLPNEKEMINLVIKRFSEIFSIPPDKMNISVDINKKYDMIIKVKGFIFMIELKNGSSTIQVESGIKQLLFFIQNYNNKNIISLLVVPYMGKIGMEQCKEKQISWIDLSGNAFINGKNLLVNISGNRNKYLNRGRPSSVFAPKSSRIARFLLINHNKYFLQNEIAQSTDMDEGYTSKIIKKLEKNALIKRDKKGKVSVKNAELLLRSWLEYYNFKTNEIISGVIPIHLNESVVKKVVDFLKTKNVLYAMTGLSAAWLLTKFTDYKIATFYLQNYSNISLLSELGFYKSERGANVWFVIPKDKEVFQGSYKTNDISHVHPVQIYIDLIKSHLERSIEAAERIKKEYLNW